MSGRVQYPPQPLSGEAYGLARREGQRWVPETMSAAEWAVQRLSEATAERDLIRAEVAEYVAQVRAWAEERVRGGRHAELQADIAFFEDALATYARKLRAESVDRKGEPRVKTIKLPSATIETRKARDRAPKFVVEDMDALVQWAEQGAPDAIRRTVDVKALKLLVIADEADQEFVINGDGERVPGVGFTWDQEEREPGVTIRLHDDKPAKP